MVKSAASPGSVEVSFAADAGEWDAFIEAHPEASAYHRWGWRSIFEEAFGHETIYLIARQAGEIRGALPIVAMQSALFGRFGVSLPFVNYGGVLADDPVVAEQLLACASDIARERRLSHLELRHRVRRFTDLPVKQHKVGMLLPLESSEEKAWSLLDRKVRNQIRKAEKSELQASVGGREQIPDFYRVFAKNMHDLGTPVYSRSFFEAVVERFAQQTRVIVVRSGLTPVAAGIACQYRETVEVPWASSLKTFRHMCPNNLLYWTIIQRAIADGARMLDFGRSTRDEGTYHFKEQWGARPEPLHWEYQLLTRHTVPDQSPKNPKYRLAISTWKHLPLGLTMLLGPRIVRSIP